MSAYANDLGWLFAAFFIVGSFAFVAIVMGLMYLGYRKVVRTRRHRKRRGTR